jgi:prevent-host-death family protein
MIRANIAELKAHLSEFIERVTEGETIEICNRNRPVARISPIPTPNQPRKLGKYRGLIIESSDAWDPMSEEELNEWDQGL